MADQDRDIPPRFDDNDTASLETPRLALQLQLDDIEAILDSTTATTDERVAFEALRTELLGRYTETVDAHIAYGLLVTENASHASSERLGTGEVQAGGEHTVARGLADGSETVQVARSPHAGATDQTVATEASTDPDAAAQASSASLPTAVVLSETTSDSNAATDQLHAVPTPDTAAAASLTAPAAQQHTLEELPPDSADTTADLTEIESGSLNKLEDVSSAEKLAQRGSISAPDSNMADMPEINPNRPIPSDEVLIFPHLISWLRSWSPGKSSIDSSEKAREEEEADGHGKQLCLDASISELHDTKVAAADPPAVLDSLTATDNDKVAADPQVKCASCLETHPDSDLLHLLCVPDDKTESHSYCGECLVAMFNASITDPSLFPPRCCSKEIPLPQCALYLDQELIDRFTTKRDELDTPNRTYCSNPSCAKWIRPESIEAGVATCEHCQQKTCAICKSKEHDGLCPEDEGVKELMEFAKEKKWQTCPQCWNMVELSVGCYHILCRCRYEFCYLCAARWKTCDCENADEEHIVDEPEQEEDDAINGPELVNNEPEPENNNGNGRGDGRRINHEHAYRRTYDGSTAATLGFALVV